MVLFVQEKRILINHKKWYQHTVPFQCWVIVECDIAYLYIFSKWYSTSNTRMGWTNTNSWWAFGKIEKFLLVNWSAFHAFTYHVSNIEKPKQWCNACSVCYGHRTFSEYPEIIHFYGCQIGVLLKAYNSTLLVFFLLFYMILIDM